MGQGALSRCPILTLLHFLHCDPLSPFSLRAQLADELKEGPVIF